jgi:hypothetical protein
MKGGCFFLRGRSDGKEKDVIENIFLYTDSFTIFA